MPTDTTTGGPVFLWYGRAPTEAINEWTPPCKGTMYVQGVPWDIQVYVSHLRPDVVWAVATRATDLGGRPLPCPWRASATMLSGTRSIRDLLDRLHDAAAGIMPTLAMAL